MYPPGLATGPVEVTVTFQRQQSTLKNAFTLSP
jgi:hypothetical protein